MSYRILALLRFIIRRRSGRNQLFHRLLLVALACLGLTALPACDDSEIGRMSDEAALIDDELATGDDLPLGDGMQRVIVQLQRGMLQPFSDETTIADLAERLEQRSEIIDHRTAMLNRMWDNNYQITELRSFETLPAVVVEADGAAIAALRRNPSIASVVPDMQLELYLNQSAPLIGAPAAWSAGYEGSGWAVAVLDTGTDYNHPHFAGRLAAEACFSTTYPPLGASSLCPNGLDAQVGAGGGINCNGFSGCDHGTHVAGTAVGVTGSVQGIARSGNIVPVQVFSSLNDGSITAFASDLIAALDYVLTLSEAVPIAAVNMSLGGGSYTGNCDSEIPAATAAIQNLRAVGIATVVASGNAGNANAIGFPACISGAIAVGATSKSDVVASYSNAGAELELLAPGSSIRSPVFNNSLGLKSGTSMATPHVAGAFAVLRSANAIAEVDVLADALKDTGVLLVDGRTGQAWPRIQLNDAVTAVLDNDDENPTEPVEPILLERSFDDNGLAGFTVHDQGNVSAPSQWTVDNGVVNQRSNIYANPFVRDSLPKAGTHLRYESGQSWTDYRTTVNLRSTDNDTIGVIFRQRNENNFYRFSWDEQRRYRRLVKNVNGQFTLLAEDSAPFVIGQQYELEITANGSNITASIDGSQIFQVNDASLAGGTVALFVWANDGASFDNLLVEDLNTGNPGNTAPVITAVSATPDNLNENATSQLQVEASDADGDSLMFTWEVPAGEGSLSNPNIANPVFTPASVSADREVTLSVFVSDGSDAVSDQITVTVTDSGGSGAGTVLLNDDFSDGNLEGWTAVDESSRSGPGTWQVSSGRAIQTRNAYADGVDRASLPKRGTYLLRDDGLSWTDYSFSVEMESGDNDAIGLMFRVQDSDNYYRFSWDTQRGYRRIVKNSGGNFSLLAEDATPYQTDVSYLIELRAIGNQIELRIDGVSIFSVTDGELTSGSVALYSWGNLPSYFDNVAVVEQ